MATIYWISTLIIAGFLLLSSYTYFFNENTIVGVEELGFPNFFRIQLGVLKIIAALDMIIPGLPIFVKDWGYAGVGLFLLTAFVAHVAHRDSIGLLFLLLFLFSALAVSRYSLSLVCG